jgi:hypothetical protein
MQSARDSYEQALALRNNPVMVNAALQDARALLEALAVDLEILDETMRGLWAPRLKDAGLAQSSILYLKHRDLYREMAKSLEAAAAKHAVDGTLPPAAELGLEQIVPQQAFPAEKAAEQK